LPDNGSFSTLKNISLDDVKKFYTQYYNPAKANIVVVGDIQQSGVNTILASLNDWQPKQYSIPAYSDFPEYPSSSIYLVDKPGAVQSVIDIIKRSLPYDAAGEFFKMRLMNFPLGGNFNSRINLNLREDKGFTYGASSYFSGGKTLGSFSAGGDFNALYTIESIEELFEEISGYREQGPNPDELALLKTAFTQGDALKYETPGSKARFLRHLLVHNLAKDYTDEQLNIINSISAETLTQLAKVHLDLNDMQIVVVGDAASLKPKLEALGRPIIEFKVAM
jgi:zinc protease